MADIETFTESTELLLTVFAMAALVVGGWMLYHSVMANVGAAVLALSFICMFVVVGIS